MTAPRIIHLRCVPSIITFIHKKGMTMTTHDHTGGAVTYARTFAKIFGPVLLLVGIVGLVLGNDPLLDLLNIDVVEDMIHVASGLLLIVLGYTSVSAQTVKLGVLVLGVVYLLVTALGFAEAGIIRDLNPHGYGIVDNLIHLVVGVGAVAAALIPRGHAHDH